MEHWISVPGSRRPSDPNPMSLGRVFVVLGILGSLLGCMRNPDPVPPLMPALDPEAERLQRDSAVAVLSRADRRALDAAFGALGSFSYERSAVIRELDRSGAMEAERVWRDRFEGPPGSRRRIVLSADSSGQFAEGFFRRFSRRAVPGEFDAELAPFILPSDPPYLTGRGREAYRFRFLPDSLAHGRSLIRILIEADPADPGRQQLRRILVTLEPDSLRIVGTTVLFDHYSLLYRERSLLSLYLAPLGAVWLPDHLDMESRIGSTVFDERHFAVRMDWSNLRPAP